MNTTNLQLTIRGLNKETKEALQQRASQQGMSLNKYILKTLRQGAGINVNENRYLELKGFLSKHSLGASDKKAFDDALSWADNASKEKQSKDEHDSSI
jgi:uncharacterized protein (DUF1778 family)